MKRDGRLSGVLHVVLHMAQHEGPATSEVLAKVMNTNPVVLRRVMAGLREQGYVQSEKGHGGGWTLTCDLEQVTLRDIYTALGSPSLLAIGHRAETPDCLVEAAVNAALHKSFEEAESLLISRLGEVTLAMLSQEVRSRLAPRAHVNHNHAHHCDSGARHSVSGHGYTVHPFATSDAVSDDPARDGWQHPDAVLRALDLQPAMNIADVGAGTGYFSVRLARAVPQGEVIATDLEPGVVRLLSERARREQLPNLRAIHATPKASGLPLHSLDRILVVHVWHHLADRGEFARALAAALRPGGRLFVVDFTPAPHGACARQLIGPPASMRHAPQVIIAALESAGLSARISPVPLPDQFMVEARRPEDRAPAPMH